jgi:hypothetical protein
MSNSKTSDQSRAVQEIKDRFALIAATANRAVYGNMRFEDALSDIDAIAEEIGCIAEQARITQPGIAPHYYNGIKW